MKRLNDVCYLIPVLLLLNTGLQAQTVSSEYTTSSITPLMVKFDEYQDTEWAFEEGFKQINLSNKYFNNTLDGKLVAAIGKKEYIASFKEEIERYTPRESKLMKRVVKGVESGVASAMIGEKALLSPTDSLGLAFAQTLQENTNIDEKILKLWARKDAMGNFITLNQRSELALNTVDLQNQVDAQKLDAFRDLFYKNYIFLFDFGDIMDAERYADKYPTNAGLSAAMSDYVVEVNTYVYKLDMDDRLFEQVKKNFRTGDFSKLDIPIKYVGRYLSVAEAGSSNRSANASESPAERKVRRAQVHAELAQKAYDEIIELAEMRIEDFKLRTKVTSGFPNKVKAQIGINENVKLDQRYFAYENELDDATGELKSNLKGVIRVAEIVDNVSDKKEDDGGYKDTRFYQVWGDPIKEGMFLVQESDFGVGVSAGLRTMRRANFNFRAEYRVSPWLKKLWKSSPLVNTNIYVDIFFADASFSSDGNTEVNLSTGMGLSTKFYINKWIRPEPYIGYYLLDGFNFMNLGVRADFPLKHNVFIVPEIGLSTAKGKNDNFSPVVVGVSLKSEI